MRAFVTFIGFALLVGATFADDYQVKHRRPSSLLANLAGKMDAKDRLLEIKGNGEGLIAAGVQMKADDLAGIISITGDAERVESMKQILAEFDRATQKLSLRVTLVSKLDKFEGTTKTEVNNNSNWTFSNETVGVTMSIRPRINGDGTITAVLFVSSDERKMNIVVRKKIGESFPLHLSGNGEILTVSGERLAKPEEKPADKGPGIQVVLQFDLIDQITPEKR